MQRVYPLFSTTLFFLFALLSYAASAQQSTQQCQTIKVNGSDSWEPVSFRNNNGELEGIAADIIEEISRRLEIEVVYQNDLPWLRQFLMLDHGRLDAIMGVYFTEERDAKYVYSSPFMEEQIRVFVNSDNKFKFESAHDLIGRLGMRPLGGSYGTDFDQFDENFLTTQRYRDSSKAFKLLANRRIDYIVLAHFDGIATARKLDYESIIEPLPTSVANLPVYFLFSPHSSCIAKLPEINQTIKELESEGFLDQIKGKYLEAY